MENPKISGIKSVSAENLNDTLKRLVAPIALAAMTAVAGCGGQANSYSENNCPDCECPDAGSAGAGGAGGSEAEDHMTRGELAVAIKEDVMGYNEIKACDPNFFPDDEDIQNDSRLCDAANLLNKRGGMDSYPNGTFRADDLINRAETFKVAGQSVGLAGYPDICTEAVSDISYQDWFYPYTNALCMHGIPVTKDDGLMHPADTLTKEDWKSVANHINAYMNTPADRIGTSEAIYSVLLDNFPAGGEACVSLFPDIADRSMECVITNMLEQEGIINGYSDGKFGPKDAITWAQLSKLYAVALGLDVTKGTGCSGAEATSWYAAYADALCDNGYIEQGSMTDEKALQTPTKRDVYKLAWDIQLDQNGY